MRCLFTASLPTFVGCGVVDGSYVNGSEVESQCGLICISFMSREDETFFM
jgi:hypothetical protein